MKPKVLCPKWGKSKATKTRPLKKVHRESGFEVYVRGECANEDVTIERSQK